MGRRRSNRPGNLSGKRTAWGRFDTLESVASCGGHHRRGKRVRVQAFRESSQVP